MAVKLNTIENYELPIIVIRDGSVSFKLSEESTPIAYRNMVEELLENGECRTEEEAKKVVDEAEFELEIYYEKGYGLFAVESENATYLPIFSPYTGEPCER